jgi:hypothetical protein
MIGMATPKHICFGYFISSLNGWFSVWFSRGYELDARFSL